MEQMTQEHTHTRTHTHVQTKEPKQQKPAEETSHPECVYLIFMECPNGPLVQSCFVVCLLEKKQLVKDLRSLQNVTFGLQRERMEYMNRERRQQGE